MIKGQALFLLKYHLTPGSTSEPFQMAHKVSALCVCALFCVCIRYGTVFLSLQPRISDTIVSQQWTRQPPVLAAPPKAQGPPPPHLYFLPVLTCVARLACTLVAVDFVDAAAVVAGFALTVVQVHLTVETWRFENKLANDIRENLIISQ